jgi:ApaG protein
MYEAETDGIFVRVFPVFLERESDPNEPRFVWAYNVEIENRGGVVVRLLSRYWRITEATGLTHEVRGDGVIGQQPVLQPGQIHQYTSAAPLSSPCGMMGGSYRMQETESGRRFDVAIPTFALESPFATRLAN